MPAVSMCVEVPGSCQKMIKNLEIILNSTHSASNSRRLHKTHSRPVRQGKKIARNLQTGRLKPTTTKSLTSSPRLTRMKPTNNSPLTYVKREHCTSEKVTGRPQRSIKTTATDASWNTTHANWHTSF